MFREILLLRDKSEVVEVCNKSINLTFEGTPGADCKWLHYFGTGQESCCYISEERRGLSLACSHHNNSPDCRSQANASLPKVNLFENGKKCRIVVKTPSVQDIGRYEGYMPHKNLTRSIDHHDICVNNYHLSADTTYHLSLYWFLFLFIFAAVVLFIVTLIKWKCSHCCRRS